MGCGVLGKIGSSDLNCIPVDIKESCRLQPIDPGPWKVWIIRWMSLDLTDDKPTLVQVWPGTIRHQAITRANVDQNLYHYMTSSGLNVLSDDLSKTTVKVFWAPVKLSMLNWAVTET